MPNDDWLNLSDDQPSDELVEIIWGDAVPTWVRPRRDWADHCSGQELLDRVVELVNAQLPAEAGGDWRSALKLSRLTLPELREFNLLVAEARAEERSAPTPVQVQSTARLRAVWYGGRLLELTADQGWLTTVDAAELAEELTDAVQPPPVTDTRTASRDRLIRYVGGTRV